MNDAEREARTAALTLELGYLAKDLAEQAENVSAAAGAGDTDEMMDAAEIMVCTGQQFAAVRRSLMVAHRPLRTQITGPEMSST